MSAAGAAALACELQQFRRYWLVAGACTAGLLLVRVQIQYRALAVIVGVARENRWNWQTLTGVLMTLAGGVVMLVAVVAFWPVVLWALLRDAWEVWVRRRAARRAPPGY